MTRTSTIAGTGSEVNIDTHTTYTVNAASDSGRFRITVCAPGECWTCPFCHGQAHAIGERVGHDGTARWRFGCRCGGTFDMQRDVTT